jgi:hypothetical protein
MAATARKARAGKVCYQPAEALMFFVIASDLLAVQPEAVRKPVFWG